MRTFEDVCSLKDKYRGILEKNNDALMTYVDELKRMKKFLVETASGATDIEIEE